MNIHNSNRNSMRRLARVCRPISRGKRILQAKSKTVSRSFCMGAIHGKNGSTGNTGNPTKQKFDLSVSSITPTERTLSAIDKVVSFPLSVLMSWSGVKQNERMVVTHFGKLVDVREPGLRWAPGFFADVQKVGLHQRSIHIPKSTVADRNGNPIEISTIVNWRVIDPKKWVFNVNLDSGFIQNQADAVVKKIGAKYPYECSQQSRLSLKGETEVITKEMIDELQARCDVAGVTIDNVSISDLNYAPEIAQQMLVRQQAKAYVDARKDIVKAAVDISANAVTELETKSLQKMSRETKEEIVRNLLTVIAGGNGAQPTLPLTK